ncbi:hypothetical protein CAPTEDRAFT_146733 [Capitella teleta]|uniref:Carbohydrate deacetylase n=1 Tax=Capitella teleta TaxID=283909 RepID=R7TW57_CAPTE|nr:hypothetical protein CAPTEDRAFT_146733 [Capitella teleta]|eukprot:ELT97964.1 hypothetical protein CAPTEDRAFT_146733 [Capitella teleta]
MDEVNRGLIITADDLGYNRERCDGILECFQQKAISRTSLMVNASDTERSACLAVHAGLTIGLHFNITEGKPVSPIKEIPSLLKDGQFYAKDEIREAILNNVIDLEEVRTELENQIRAFRRATGKAPSYVDGHQHAHVLPGVSEVFASTLLKHLIGFTRLPVEPKGPLYPWNSLELKEFFIQVIADAEKSRPIFDQHAIKYPESFVGLALMGSNMEPARLQDVILDAFTTLEHEHPGAYHTVELMCHPGYPGIDPASGCGVGADDFSMSDERRHEMNVLTGRAMKQFYAQSHIQIVDGIF